MDMYGEEAPLVDMSEFPEWIVQEDDNLLILNKPGWLVCHPSKNGPLSSLVGAVREHTQEAKLHLVARLDRETSGLIVFAKRPSVARKFQMAIQNRIVRKHYLAILEGTLPEPITVDQSIARRKDGPVHVKNEVSYVRGAQSAMTHFEPYVSKNGYTFCGVKPETGRKHQIRVHAEWLGHNVVADKIYGPDETLYLDFIEAGWNARLEKALPIKRQALHCYEYIFDFPEAPVIFRAPLPQDLSGFCREKMGLSGADLERFVVG
ncbi:MAG: RluA family pseudouridine synthase [Verrucomicrobiota bacterium]